MTYERALQFLDSLANYEKQFAWPRSVSRSGFKLDRIRRLLASSGNPQARMPPVLLVAGTKGKGSVCYLLEAALRGCGLRTGLFVSPHVLDVRERIQLDGHLVSKRRFASLVDYFRPLVTKQPVSYFELTVAMAFQLFAEEQPDYAVIEVGLGGRLDATNISDPVVSVITRIGLDHVKVLGTTKRVISREKAGIMRPGRPVVVAPQSPEVTAELCRCAGRIGARWVSVSERSRWWGVDCSRNRLSFSCFCDLGPCHVELGILGRHQVENCATVLVVLSELNRSDKRISLPEVIDGLRSTVLPARCQLVCERPLIIVDSCHNPDSGQALADVIRDYVGQRVILVYGSLRNKLVTQTVAPLVPFVEQALLTQASSPRALQTGTLARVFSRLGIKSEQVPSVPAALRRAMLLAGRSRPVVVGGSFYVAGEVLASLDSVVVSPMLEPYG